MVAQPERNQMNIETMEQASRRSFENVSQYNFRGCRVNVN
jgi:hypothetical protein